MVPQPTPAAAHQGDQLQSESSVSDASVFFAVRTSHCRLCIWSQPLLRQQHAAHRRHSQQLQLRFDAMADCHNIIFRSALL